MRWYGKWGRWSLLLSWVPIGGDALTVIAGVLRELGLPQGQFVPALIAFNVGVELGQLLFIAVIPILVVNIRRFQAQEEMR